jgi:hypothetical protein
MLSKENNYPIEVVRRWPDQYSTEEIRLIIGNFEEEYKSHANNARVNNHVLGKTSLGIVNWCVNKGYITEKTDHGGKRYHKVGPNYEEFNKFYSGMNELRIRREYVNKRHLEELDEILKQKDQLANPMADW